MSLSWLSFAATRMATSISSASATMPTLAAMSRTETRTVTNQSFISILQQISLTECYRIGEEHLNFYENLKFANPVSPKTVRRRIEYSLK